MNILKRTNLLFLLFVILILSIGFVLRFYKLDSIPPGLYQDETAIGYNAYSILKTGADEYGKSFPLYFKSFGDYKLPVYIYSTIPAILLFGLNAFAVRLPSALFGFLTIPLVGLLMFRFTKNKYFSAATMAILAILPWHLHYNRATFEVSISLFLFTLGLYFLHKAFFDNKSKGMFILGTLSFVLGLYTYNLTRLLAPLIYILILVFFRKNIKTVNKIEIILSAIIGSILLTPLILTLFQHGGSSSASGTLIFSSAAVQAPFLEFRSFLVNSHVPLVGIAFNKLFMTAWQYLNNIAAYFSVDFFFLKGSLHGNHGIGNFGEFYLVQLPFLILGIVTIIRKRINWGLLMLGWAILTILTAALTRDVPHATRSFFLILPCISFITLGIFEAFNFVKTQKKYIQYLAIFVVFILSVYNLVYYFSSYYFRFPIVYAKAWSYSDKELVSFLKPMVNQYDQIIIDNNGPKYTSLLFYLEYSPQEFQRSVVRAIDDSEGFSEVKSFGNFEFRSIDWDNDLKLPNAIIITSADKVAGNAKIIKTFTIPERPVVIAKGQEILSFPTTDTTYAVIETRK